LLLFIEYKVEGGRAKVDLDRLSKSFTVTLFRCANIQPEDTATISRLITHIPNQNRDLDLALFGL